MEFKPSSNDRFLLHDKLFKPGFTEKRAVVEKLFETGFGAYVKSSRVLRQDELHNLGRALANHPELKKLGWTKYDTEHVKSVLGEHFAPQSHEQPLHTNNNEPPVHTSHMVPPAADDNDVAPVRQIV